MTRPFVQVGGDALIVVAPGAAETILAAARELGGSAESDALIAAVQSAGKGMVPSFALAVREGRHVRLFVRGEYAVAVDDATSIRAAAGITTWREEVTVATVLEVSDGGGSLVRWLLPSEHAGEQLAVTVERSEHDSLGPDEAEGAVGLDAADSPAGVDGAAHGDEEVAPDVTVAGPVLRRHRDGDPSRVTEVDDVVGPVTGDEAPAEDVTIVGGWLARAELPPAPPAPTKLDVGRVTAAADDATLADLPPPVAEDRQDTAVIGGAPPAPVVRPTPVGGTDEAGQADGPVSPGPRDLESSGGVITSVPWASDPRPAAVGPQTTSPAPEAPAALPSGAVSSSTVGDHDGHTVPSDALARLRAGGGAVTPPSTADVDGVPSLVCSEGHPNPPASDHCRSCDASLAGRTEVMVPRPTIVRLVFDHGEVREVDRPQIVGRRPSVREGSNLGQLVGLVTVPDPEHELSRSHLEVRVTGWSVDVVDPGSLNGTTIHLPGQDPIRARPGVPYLVVPGTTVRLADVTSFTVEVPR